MMNNLSILKVLNAPLLVGVSRKSMIYRLLGTDPEHALNGTTILHTVSVLKHADIIRVHDVNEANEVLKILDYIDR